MKMKKIAMIMVVIIMSATTCMASASNVNQVLQKPIKVFYNGLAINFPDQQPIIIGGRTMVPIRPVAETLGYEVIWNEGEREVQIYSRKSEAFIYWKIGETTYYTNHGCVVDVGCAPMIINGRTMVPIRFLTEQLSQMEIEFVSQKYQDFIFMKNWFKAGYLKYPAFLLVK